MKLYKIEPDTSLDRFNFLPFNRKYEIRRDLIESMNRFGFITPIVCISTDLVIGSKRLYILDGQHRLATAKHLNIAAYYIIIEPENVNTIEDLVLLVASMNSKSKPWIAENYVEAFAYLNYPDYKSLLSITSQSAYSINLIAALLVGNGGKCYASDKVKSGTFKITHSKETKETLNFAAELSKYTFLSSRMILALSTVMKMKDFNRDNFTKNYKSQCKNIKELKLDDYTDLFKTWI